MSLPRRPWLTAALLGGLSMSVSCAEPSAKADAGAGEAGAGSTAKPSQSARAGLPPLGEPLDSVKPLPRATVEREGPIQLKAGPALAGEIEQSAAHDGHRLILVTYDHLDSDRLYQARVLGDRHGVALPVSETPNQRFPSLSRRQMIVRLVGAAPLDAPLEIELILRHDDALWAGNLKPDRKGEGRVGVRRLLTITPKAGASAEVEPAAFYQAGAAWFSHGGAQRTLLEAYASARMEALRSGKEAFTERLSDQRRRRPRGDHLEEAMSLYTGMTSVEEALQAERALVTGAEGPQTVEISAVEAVPMASHPWPEMIASLGKAPVIEPLAHRVPADHLYVHFDDPGALSRVMDELEDRVAPALAAFERRPGAAEFAARYQRQLMVERTALSKILGPRAASAMALVASDVLFREGSDLSILFQIRDRGLLMTALDTFQAAAAERHGPLKVIEVQIAGASVRLTTSADGAVHQYRAEVDGVLILSTTEAAMTRLLTVGQPDRPSLASAGDFQYMRALYPADDQETGFIFLGDAFVAHMVSPRLKVLQARRLLARADLLAVAHAALLYRWLEGAAPAGVEALITAGLLPPGGDRHADGAQITLDPVKGPRSTWGSLEAMRPLDGLTVDKITAEEKSAYDEFRSSYQAYWRRFIDPVAVRIEQTGGLLRVDARILPLIEGSAYDELIETVGQTTAQWPALGDGLQWFMAIGPDAQLRREVSTVVQEMALGGAGGLDWLGDWVGLGVRDSDVLWNMAVGSGEMGGPRAGRSNDLLEDFPGYAMVHIKNPVIFAGVMTRLKAQASQVGVPLDWGVSGQHQGVDIIRITEKGGFFGKFSLYYALAGEVWVISFNRKVVEDLITTLAQRPHPTLPGLSPSQGALSLRPRPDGRLLTLLQSIVEGSQRGQLARSGRMIEHLGWLGARPKTPEARRAQALAWAGVVPSGWAEGAWQIDEATGLADHAIYGAAVSPRWPAIPGGGGPYAEALAKLAWVFAGVSIEGEGDHRGLRVQVRWATR